ncbi:LOW QUALITY PROTEIN: misshapen-like kinase 1 [Rhinoraja longicauda]
MDCSSCSPSDTVNLNASTSGKCFAVMHCSTFYHLLHQGLGNCRLSDKLKSSKVAEEISRDLDGNLVDTPHDDQDITDEEWVAFRDAMYSIALEHLGPASRSNQNWFDENDKEIQALLSEKHKVFSASQIQGYADSHDTRRFYDALKAVYGPQSSGSSPFLNADGTQLLAEKKQILERCAEHFNQEYKRKQLEEQRQSERLQRQLQQEHAFLMSLQQQQQQQQLQKQQQQQQQQPQEKKQLYYYNKNVNPTDKPAWAKEVEERSKMNRQNSPAAKPKMGTTISDPSLQSLSEPVPNNSTQASQTPPMHRPVEPQGAQSKFQVAHLVALKPSVQVPRSQSLQDQPTKNVAAFPSQEQEQEPAPVKRGEMLRQNSDPRRCEPGKARGDPDYLTTQQTRCKYRMHLKSPDMLNLGKDGRPDELPKPPVKVMDYSSLQRGVWQPPTMNDEEGERTSAQDENLSSSDGSRSGQNRANDGDTDSVSTMVVHDDEEPAVVEHVQQQLRRRDDDSSEGVNLLVGTENGLMLLDRGGQGKVYSLISRRRFQQMDVLEGLNLLITISGRRNKLRVYYLSWLRNKILHNDPGGGEEAQGWTTVGDMEGCVHYKVVKYERIKFLVIALKNSVEVYAWAPKPYHKFMAFKSFMDLPHRPSLVDLTVEEGQRLKVVYGSNTGFHAVDVDSGNTYDVYIPVHIQSHMMPHAIVILPNAAGMEMLLCYEDEGVYVNTYGRIMKDVVLQWGEMPTSVAYICSNQIMGWGEKAIEIRSVETGHLDGVFMHKRAQRLKFLCERNDKVFFASVRSGGSSQVYFMTLNRNTIMNW